MQIKKTIKYSLILTGSLTTALSLKKVYDIDSRINLLYKKISENSSKDLYEVHDSDYIQFPWTSPFKSLELEPEDWEMRKIKIKGQLAKTRWFIQQEKDGKQGYLVYTGLTTGITMPSSPVEEEQEKYTGTRRGIIINLGWVPLSNVNLTNNPNFLKTKKILSEKEKEKDDIFEVYRDPYTGFIYQGMDPDEMEEEPSIFDCEKGMIINEEFIIEGFLRKPRKTDILLGRLNDEYYGFLANENLDRMRGFFMFDNCDAGDYYLERTEDLKRNKRVGFPMPLNEADLRGDFEDYERNGIYSKFWKLAAFSGMFVGGCLFI